MVGVNVVTGGSGMERRTATRPTIYDRAGMSRTVGANAVAMEPRRVATPGFH